MPRRALAALALAVCIAALPARAAEPAGKPASAVPQVDMAAAMQEFMKISRPGEGHEKLKAYVGEWATTTRLWLGPGQPPAELPGTATFRAVMGGRFVEQEFSGSLPLPDEHGKFAPQPFHGMGLMGFDNYRHVYSMAWVDESSTALMTGVGTPSQDGKTLTFYGAMDEPEIHVAGRTVKYQIRWQDADHFTFTVIDLAVAEDFKAYEIAYTRKK